MPDTTLLDQSSFGLDAPLPGVTELPDGGALVELDSEPVDSSTEDSEHTANLAESLDKFKLTSIASTLLELIEKDREARVERDKLQEEGIRRTGLGDDAPGGATFDGASRVVHPVLAEGCVDFSARAIKELFPSNGPVRTKIYGVAGDVALEGARKKRDFLNWYLVEKMTEYRSEKEALLTQLPLGGSQYEKYWFDGKRVRMEFVPVDKVLLPYAANSFYDSGRVTNEQEKTEEEVDRLVDTGFYSDVFGPTGQAPDATASQSANNKVEGKTESGYNEDGVRVIYEVSCNFDVEGDGTRPYVIHIDEPSGKIAAIYRNWREGDDSCERLDWWVEDKFLPWRGAYGIGLPHLIGGLAASLTGSLRALLDSAHINNAPTAIKLKGSRASGQNVSMDITSVTEIEAPAGVDDIRKIMMPMPFNPPSQVLFQLLGWLSEQAKGVVATAEERLANVGHDTPVGTTLALIEQGSQTYSSIHSRLHDSQRRALRIICRLLHDYPEHVLEDMQRFGVTPEDFATTSDISPVSDPNIFSEAQRFAQMQAVMQLAAQDAADPQMPWNKIVLRRRMLELLRVDGVDELLPKPPKPVTADPLTESLSAMKGMPIKPAFEQDHIAHLHGHLAYLSSPFVLQNPLIQGQPMMAVLVHMQEHVEMLTKQVVGEVAQTFVAKGVSQDEAAAAGIAQASEQLAQQLGKIMPKMFELLQQVQTKMPKPPMPPEVTASLQIAQMDIERKSKVDQATLQMNQQKFQVEMQRTQQQDQMDARLRDMQMRMEAEQAAAKFQMDKQRIGLEHQAQMFEQVMEQQRTEAADRSKQLEAQLSILLNKMDNRQHQETEIAKNHEDNQTAIQIEQMKEGHKLVGGIIDNVMAPAVDQPLE